MKSNFTIKFKNPDSDINMLILSNINILQVVNEIGMDASDEQVKTFCENLLKSGQVI